METKRSNVLGLMASLDGAEFEPTGEVTRVFIAGDILFEDVMRLTDGFYTDSKGRVSLPLAHGNIRHEAPVPGELKPGDAIFYRRSRLLQPFTGWDCVVITGVRPALKRRKPKFVPKNYSNVIFRFPDAPSA